MRDLSICTPRKHTIVREINILERRQTHVALTLSIYLFTYAKITLCVLVHKIKHLQKTYTNTNKR